MKNSIVKKGRVSSVIHSRIRFMENLQRKKWSILSEMLSFLKEHLLQKMFSHLFSIPKSARWQFVLCLRVRQKKVYVRDVMGSILRQQISSLSVLQSVSSLLSRSVNQELSLRCVHSTRDESRRKEVISRRVSLVSKNSSKHEIQNILRRLLHSMERSQISKKKDEK